MKKLTIAGLAALATMSLLNAQGPSQQTESAAAIGPSKGVPTKSHSEVRFEKICADLKLSEGQLQLAMDLWAKTAKKLAATYDVKTSEKARTAPIGAIKTLAEQQFLHILTKPQRAQLAEMLKSPPATAMARPGSGSAAANAEESSAGKICWSCWPGKCDRTTRGLDRIG